MSPTRRGQCFSRFLVPREDLISFSLNVGPGGRQRVPGGPFPGLFGSSTLLLHIGVDEGFHLRNRSGICQANAGQVRDQPAHMCQGLHSTIPQRGIKGPVHAHLKSREELKESPEPCRPFGPFACGTSARGHRHPMGTPRHRSRVRLTQKVFSPVTENLPGTINIPALTSILKSRVIPSFTLSLQRFRGRCGQKGASPRPPAKQGSLGIKRVCHNEMIRWACKGLHTQNRPLTVRQTEIDATPSAAPIHRASRR